MSGATKAGYEGLLYYGTAGTTAMTQMLNCEDLNYDQDVERGETTVRGAGVNPPIVTSRVTARKAVISWKMMNKPADTVLTALRAASATGAAVALRTKDSAAGKGFDGDCTLSVKNGMPLKGMATFEFTAEPTDDEGRDPQLYV